MQSIKFKNIFSLLKLAAPLIANNLAIAGIQVTDALMSSQLGSKELAAVAVGGSIWFLIFSSIQWSDDGAFANSSQNIWRKKRTYD